MTTQTSHRRATRGIAVAMLTALAVLPAAACSSSSSSSPSQSRACAQLDSLVASTKNLSNTTVSENGLAAVAGQLQQVQTQLEQLATEVSSAVKPKVATAQSQVHQLQESIAAVRTDPTGENLAAAHTALITLQATIAALPSAVEAAC